MIKKIKNDYKCEKCGKIAVYNLQNYWHLYDIESNGNFTESDSWEADVNEFWCDSCYNSEYNKD